MRKSQISTEPERDESPSWNLRLGRLLEMLGWPVLLLGVLALAGWGFGIPLFKTPLAALPPMKVNSALCFLWGGAALVLSRERGGGALTVPVLASGVLLLAGVNLAEWAIGFELGLNQFFFRDDSGFPSPGRIPPVSAVIFILLGAAQLLLIRRQLLNIFAISCLFLAFSLSLGVLAGYGLWFREIFRVPFLTSTALYTALGQILLSFGITGAFLVRIPSLQGFRKRLLIFGGAALAACLAFLTWVFVTWTDYRQVHRDAELFTSNLAVVLKEHARRSFDPAVFALKRVETLVEEKGVAEIAGSEFFWRRIRDIADEAPQISSIGILDRQGRLRLLTTRFPFPPQDFSYREYFKAHRDLGEEIHLGPMIVARSSGKNIFTISRKLTDSRGEFAGVVLASMEMEYFRDFYRTLDLGPHAAVGLFRIDGKPLAREPFLPGMVGLDLSDQYLFTTLVHRSPSGNYSGISPVDGKEKVLAYRAAEDFPLVVLATLEMDSIIGRFEQRLVVTTAMILAALSLIGGLVALQIRMLRQEEEARVQLIASRDLAESIINSVSSQIAILDSAGRIVETNSAWRRFAEEMGIEDKGEGRRFAEFSYLAREGLALAGELDEGIGAVLSGEKETFEAQFPCRIGPGTRWYRMSVTPLKGERGGVVLQHQDITELKEAEEVLKVAATVDPLTGLLNRGALIERAERLFGMARRYGHPLSVVMLDCDHFKAINDSFGHEGGDRVLVALGDVLRREMRDTDIIGRLGGEEFVAILPHASEEAARQVAERLRQAIADMAVEVAQGHVQLTASLGVASYRKGQEYFSDLLRVSDEALYRAKAQGRNCVCVAERRKTASAAISGNA